MRCAGWELDPILNPICVCGHVFSNHRLWWDEDDTGNAGWRCDESDGCDYFSEMGIDL
jgi:hypothetical protein